MADKKISELTSITGADVDDANDTIAIVDSSEGQTKKITRGELFTNVGLTGDVTGDLTGDVTGDLTGDVTGDLTGDVTGELDLTAIAASKAVTAVDVFVYDTSKDSDGGAWRKRTQHTSWYNETLNTATRGSRREFPAVAVIVAEAAKVTIYDGDDPALPMWMVFNGATAWNYMFTFGNAPSGVTSVACLNGRLAITTTSSATNESTNGVFEIVFPADTGFKTRAVGRYKWQTNIADRNASTTASWLNNTIIGPAIVSDYLNDIAMTVLPDAPVDPATGLPVPTIAVATAGGISVITDSGAVYDLTASGLSNANHLSFFNQYLYFNHGTTSLFSGNPMYIDVSKITGDITNLTSSTDYILGHVFGFNSTLWWPAFMQNTSKGAVLLESTYLARGHAIGVTHMRFGEMPSIYSQDSMVAYTTSSYQSGWQNGDIKGAFLSDTDDTDLVGATLLDDDFSSYADQAAAEAAGYSFTACTFDAANNQVDFSGVSANLRFDPVASPAFVTGQCYQISFTVSNYVSGSLAFQDAFSTVGKAASANGTFTYTMVKSGVSSNVRVVTAGFTGSVDNISVKLADADRSVNNNGLIVNGTVTRSPVATGAELVAYSGFSSSNYLEQPYNADLDFGTGDFCIMGWVKQDGSAIRSFLDRSIPARTGALFEFRPNTSGALVIYTQDASSVAAYGISSTGALSFGSWSFVSAVRRSGTLELWADGVQLSLTTSVNISSPRDVSNAAATLSVGQRTNGTLPFNGSLALLRISATAPTAEQIKKIYNDERKLFQENAAATLYGTSDAVTALAHDEDTGLLHVGTSAGRSVFQGLRRVSNTTTAVGTAISASNGLVVEE